MVLDRYLIQVGQKFIIKTDVQFSIEFVLFHLVPLVVMVDASHHSLRSWFMFCYRYLVVSYLRLGFLKTQLAIQQVTSSNLAYKVSSEQFGKGNSQREKGRSGGCL